MSIRVVRIPSEPFISIQVSGEEDCKLIETLISRGISTWDRAPAHIKHAADEIRYGYALQDYIAQAQTKARPE